MTVISTERLARAVEARRLRDEEKLMWKEVGERLGVSKSMAFDLYHDPTGEKARERKARYATECVDCGAKVNSNGLKIQSTRCRPCRHAYERTVEGRQGRAYHSKKVWTDEQMIAAMRSVANGRPLTSSEYEAARARRKRPMPSLPLLALRFGTWREALEAAGLEHSGRKLRADYLPPEGAWLAVDECIAALGHVPTYSEYEAWAREVGAPCGTIIRRRIGGWSRVVERRAA